MEEQMNSPSDDTPTKSSVFEKVERLKGGLASGNMVVILGVGQGTPYLEAFNLAFPLVSGEHGKDRGSGHLD